MPFQNEADLLRAGARQRTGEFVNQVMSSALDALHKDIADKALDEPADAYIERANAIALGVAEAGMPELADRVYTELIGIVDDHIKRTQEHRHRGALLANRAALNIALQRYDVGIPLLQYVVRVEDPGTYGVAPEDSFGNVLRRSVLDDPALDLLLQALKGAQLPMGSTPSKHELERVFGFLGESRLVLYGVLLGLKHNIRFALKTSVHENYLALRMFDAFRAYAFFLEELTGRLVVVRAQLRGESEPAHPSGIELRDGFSRLFGVKGREQQWWARLKDELDMNSERSRRQHIAAQNARLTELADSQPQTVEDTIVTSIALLHLIRNIGAHEIYAPDYLLAPELHLERVLAWMTAAAVLVFREDVGSGVTKA